MGTNQDNRRAVESLWAYFAPTIHATRERALRHGMTDPIVMVWDLRDPMSQRVFPAGERFSVRAHRAAHKHGRIPAILQWHERGYILEAVKKGLLPEPPAEFHGPDEPGEFWAVLVACGVCSYLPYDERTGEEPWEFRIAHGVQNRPGRFPRHQASRRPDRLS